ncbi:MAG: hypothetical protein ACAI44_36525 [Candidatus Sericytochromatia bacterium]
MKLDDTECPELRDLFVAYADCRFDETEALLRSHLASCPLCGGQSDIYDLLETWARLGRAPEVTLSGDYYARLRGKLAGAEAELRRREKFWKLSDRIFEWAKVPALAGMLYLIFVLQVQPLLSVGQGPFASARARTHTGVQQTLARGLPDMVADLGALYKEYLRQKHQARSQG